MIDTRHLFKVLVVSHAGIKFEFQAIAQFEVDIFPISLDVDRVIGKYGHALDSG